MYIHFLRYAQVGVMFKMHPCRMYILALGMVMVFFFFLGMMMFNGARLLTTVEWDLVCSHKGLLDLPCLVLICF